MAGWVRTADGKPLYQDESGKVHLSDFQGNVQAVAPGEALKLLANHELSGYAPATADQLNAAAQAKEAAKTSALGAAARHAAIGVASGVLAPGKLVSGLGSAALGVEDPLAKISGRQVYQDLSAIGSEITGGESEVAAREAREQVLRDEALHPVSSTVGEIGGNIAASAVTGGGLSSLATRGAAAAGLTGRAAALASGLGASVIEGGGLGASAAAEEAWIKNSPLTAEQTLAGIGLGALFGGGSTLAFAGLAKGVPSIAKALRRAPAAAEGIEDAAARIEAGAADEGAILSGGTKAPLAPVDAVPDSFSGRARKWLSGMSDEARVESIARGNKPSMKQLGHGEIPDTAEIRDAGKTLHEMGVTGTSDSQMLEQVTAGNEASGKKIGSILDNLDATAGAEAAPRVENILRNVRSMARTMRSEATVGKEMAVADALERELAPTTQRFEARMAWNNEARVTVKDAYDIVKKLEASPSEGMRNYAATLKAGVSDAAKAIEGGYADATNLTPISQMVERLTTAPSSTMREAASGLLGRIDDVAAKADAAPRMGFRDLHTLRWKLDRISQDTGVESKLMREQLKKVRGIIEDEIKSAIQKEDPEALAEYIQNKRRFDVSNWAKDTLEERVNARDRVNRGLSLTDYKAGIGAAIAAASGGLAAAPVGIAGALGNKILRERGWSTFATLARKAAGDSVDIGAAPAAATATARNIKTLVAHAEERMNSGIGRFLGSPDTGATRGIIKRGAVNAALRSGDIDEARAAYQDHARQVQEVAAMPETAAARMSGITGEALPGIAPGLHSDMVQAANRASAYLAANMPAPPTNPDSITPQLDEPPPISRADLDHYADRVEGVEDPLSLVDDLRRGQVSPEKVDAVKNAWPQVFERIRQTVFLNLAQRTQEQGPIPQEQRILLDLALDAGGAIEPSLKPQNIALMQQAFKASARPMPAPRSRGPVPQLSKIYETRSSRLAMR